MLVLISQNKRPHPTFFHECCIYIHTQELSIIITQDNVTPSHYSNIGRIKFRCALGLHWQSLQGKQQKSRWQQLLNFMQRDWSTMRPMATVVHK